MEASIPNSDMVYGLYEGGFFGQFTRIALLLDVFTPLSKAPATAQEVASACNASVEGIRAILNYPGSSFFCGCSPMRTKMRQN